MLRAAFIGMLIPIFCFAAPGFPAQAGTPDFPAVTGPCNFEFPRDHASHPDYRIEWWYYTGNLRSAEGAPYGFQLTFFRIRTRPAGAEDGPPHPSAWRTDQIYAAHAAVSSSDSGRFYHSEKMSRGAVGLAGTNEEEGRFEVFVGDWSAQIGTRAHRLVSRSREFSFDLNLTALKDPVAHGDAGYSRKGMTASEASCYYSITRLQVQGKISLEGRELEVAGAAWMDHEYSSAPLDPRFDGWDWFSLRFSDGSDLMLYLVREKGGGFSPASSGTFVRKDGATVHLAAGDFRIERKSDWKSPHTGAVYPASWRLDVAGLGLFADIAPAMADQEMQSPGSTGVTYWEGSVRAKGVMGKDEPVTAEGYAELTGYAGELRF
ncbi:MAG: carotenoid 1,2-hydratase [Desulfobacteraceae bacterium]|nr:carotenoid 1,2-hydratase [Desulfobacteraceae bacterium]